MLGGLVFKEWRGGWGWVIFEVSAAYLSPVLITGELKKRGEIKGFFFTRGDTDTEGGEERDPP